MSAKNVVTHPKCGKSWRQRGNRTGHCAKCCETFQGIALFDQHQIIQPDGSVICRDPATMAVRVAGEPQPLRFVEDAWRGPALPEGTFPARS